MNLERIYEALLAADSLLGIAIHSGAHLQTAEGRDDAKQAREKVKAAITEIESRE